MRDNGRSVSRAHSLWLLSGLLGCGRFGFGDLATDSSVANDGAARPCDPTAAFEPPALIPELASPSVDATLRFTDDELFGVFWSGRSGSPDLYAATRPALAAPLTVSPLANVNDPDATDLDPAVSSDGSFLLFASARSGGAGGFDLYEAPRLGAEYGLPVNVTSLSSLADEHQPILLADTEVFFSSDRTGISRLYHATRTGPAAYTPPIALSELDQAGASTSDPTPSADGLTLYFASDRGGAGNNDIYVATRSSLTQPFGAITVVPSVNSPQTDGSNWLSRDGCRLYLSSARNGSVKIYLASLPP